jgi:dienelactone hydrolase
MNKSEIKLDLTDVSVAANLSQPHDPDALVIFVQESGSSHLNPNTNFVADVLNQNNISTLIVDLLTPEENKDQNNSQDIELLRTRLIRLTEKAIEQFAFDNLPVGFLGTGTGAAVAFEAASFLGSKIKAIVSLGGKTSLSKNLSQVEVPSLLISGAWDNNSIELNKKAYSELGGDKKIEIVNGASHSFEEPGALNEAASLASSWFDLYLCNKEVDQDAR